MSEIDDQLQDNAATDPWETPLDLFLDPEAMLLGALMWAPDDYDAATRVCEVLTPDDFYNVSYGEIFSLIATRRDAGHPVDAASLQSAFHALGDTSPVPLSTVRSMLLSIATLGAAPERLTAYADQVLGTSYRRQFQQMAGKLAHAAETAPEDQLFSIMVEHGKAQRRAWNRRQALKTHP